MIFNIRVTNWVKIASLLFLSVSIISQDKKILFNSLDISNGLPNNTINDIVQDELGFIWFATNDGLVRYDTPANMTTFKKGDIGLLSSNIKTIYAGKDSTLLIGTDFGGLTVLDLKTMQYTNYNASNEAPYKISSDVITAIHEDRNGYKWIGTESGLNVISPDYNDVTLISNDAKDEEKKPVNAILSIIEDSQGWIWISTWSSGLYLYQAKNADPDPEYSFRRFKLSDISASNNIWKIIQTSKNEYWIGTHGAGLFQMKLPEDVSSNDWNPLFIGYQLDSPMQSNLSANVIYDIIEDKDQNLWIATVGGLNILRNKLRDSTNKIDGVEKLSFEVHHSKSTDRTTLIGDILTTVYEDSEDNIWVGSFKGVSQFSKYSNQFIYTNIYGISQPDKRNYINNILNLNEDELILASSDEGVIIYDTKESIIHRHKTDFIPKDIGEIYHILHYSDSQFYIGIDNGIALIDIKRKSYIFYRLPSDVHKSFGDFPIVNLFLDKQNNVWAGSEYGLYLLKDINKNKQPYELETYLENQLTDISVTQVLQDSREDIWITTYNGLNKIEDPFTKPLLHLYKRKNEKEKDGIPQNQILSIAEYDGSLYLGGRNGLFKLDINTGEFDNLDIQRDRHSITDIAITPKGILWASTTDGVLIYHIDKSELSFYSEADGINTASMNSNGLYLSDQEKVYFSGANGFLEINPVKFLKNEKPPSVYITDITTINSNHTIHYNGILSEELILKPNNYYLSIDFAALNYVQPESNLYKYKLEGFEDEHWVFSKPGQKAIYTNLDKGEYTFILTAANNEGVWNEEPAKLRIIVKSYIYEQSWFKILSIVLLLLLAWYIIKSYTRRIEKRNRILKEYNENLNKEIEEKQVAEAALIEREKSMQVLVSKLDVANKDLQRSNKDLEQFAFIASHDMKEPIRTISSFTTLLKRKYGSNLDKAGQNYIDFISNGVDRLSSLVSSILEYSIAGNKEFEFRETNIDELIRNKVKDLNQLIIDKNAEIIFDAKLPTIYCAGDQIAMVFYNIILNGMKFNTSDKPTIRISSTREAKQWKFSISDNGIGIPKEFQNQVFELFKRLHRKEEFEGTGIGLALTSKIIHKHRGKLWIESEPDQGTTIFFTIPD